MFLDESDGDSTRELRRRTRTECIKKEICDMTKFTVKVVIVGFIMSTSVVVALKHIDFDNLVIHLDT